MLAVAVIIPLVSKLPPVTLALTLTVVPVCVVALTLAPPNMLPPVILPVAEINPGVVMLPPAILPVTFNVLLTLPLKLNPVAFRLPLLTLPLALISPITLNPPLENTAMFDVPPIPTVTLPPELTTVTLLVPLLMLATLVITPLRKAPLPSM